MFALRSPSHKPITVDVTVDGQPVLMELDTGAGISLISEHTYKTLLPDRTHLPSKVTLKMYLETESIPVMGQMLAATVRELIQTTPSSGKRQEPESFRA